MIKINFSSKIRCPFDLAQVKIIAERASCFSKKIQGEVEVNIVGDKLMKEINRKYRGKDITTDVLSFAWREIGDRDNLGQIFISYPQIKKQAKEYGVPIKEEFTRMLAHGLLHLVGYEHLNKKDAAKMFVLQEKIVQ